MRAHLLQRDDGARQRFADLAENILRREAELAMTSHAFEKRLGGFLIENASIDAAVVDLAEREERRKSNTPVSAAERTVHEQREKKRRYFVRKRAVRFASEHH